MPCAVFMVDGLPRSAGSRAFTKSHMAQASQGSAKGSQGSQSEQARHSFHSFHAFRRFTAFTLFTLFRRFTAFTVFTFFADSQFHIFRRLALHKLLIICRTHTDLQLHRIHACHAGKPFRLFPPMDMNTICKILNSHHS